MAASKNIPDESKFDTRTINNNLRDGNIDKAAYEAYLKDLPDESDNMDYLEIDENSLGDELTPYSEPTFTA